MKDFHFFKHREFSTERKKIFRIKSKSASKIGCTFCNTRKLKFLNLVPLEKSRNMNVPAYYIFTNDEMNKIIEEKPKTIEELRKNNILSQIKIKCHGKEIVKIVGECIEKNGKSPA